MTNVRSIPGARLFKPLVSGIALLLALGATAVAMTIQHDPDAFTRPRLLPEIEDEPRLSDRYIDTPLLEMAFLPTAKIDTVLRVGEVLVEGRRPVKVRRARPARASAARVVAAPCRDGEYRMLDPHRGVRLMCPGGSL